jgi:hypothetical protein
LYFFSQLLFVYSFYNMKSSQESSKSVTSSHTEQLPSSTDVVAANARGSSEESSREIIGAQNPPQPRTAEQGSPVQQQPLSHSSIEQQPQRIPNESDAHTDARRTIPYMLESPTGGRVFDPTAFYKAREEISLKNTNIYISGMPLFFTQEDLLTLARPFGNIVEMRLLKAVAQRGNYTTLSGFVRYFHRHESDAAIKGLNNREIGPAEASSESSLRTFESFGNGQPHILSVRYASDMKTREKEIHAAERVLGISQISGPRSIEYTHSPPPPPLPSSPMPVRDFHPPPPPSQPHHQRSSQGGLRGNDGNGASSDPGSPQQAGGRDELNRGFHYGTGSNDPLRFASSFSASSGSASGSSSVGPESGAGPAETGTHQSTSSFRSPNVSNARFTSAQHEHVHQTGVRYSPPLPHSPPSNGYIYYGQPQMQHYIPQASHSYLPIGGATYYNQAHYINSSTAHPYHPQYLQHQPGYFPQQPQPYSGYAMGYPYGIQTSPYVPSYYGNSSTPDSTLSTQRDTISSPDDMRPLPPTNSSPASEPAMNPSSNHRVPTDVQALEGMMAQMQMATNEAVSDPGGRAVQSSSSSSKIGSCRNQDSAQPQATSTGSGQVRTYRFSGQHQNHPRQ